MPEVATDDSAPRDLHKIRQFAEKYDAWSEASLRDHVFHGKENGMEEQGVIWRIGRRIYLSESAFFRWVAQQQRNGQRAA